MAKIKMPQTETVESDGEPTFRITLKGRIAIAIMPALHGEQLEQAAQRVYDEIEGDLTQGDSQ